MDGGQLLKAIESCTTIAKLQRCNNC